MATAAGFELSPEATSKKPRGFSGRNTKSALITLSGISSHSLPAHQASCAPALAHLPTNQLQQLLIIKTLPCSRSDFCCAHLLLVLWSSAGRWRMGETFKGVDQSVSIYSLQQHNSHRWERGLLLEGEEDQGNPSALHRDALFNLQAKKPH